MRRPILFAAPIVVLMIVMIIPLGNLALGGISEKYLPPDNQVRVAQEEFDRTFPGFRTEPLTLVISNDDGQPVTDQQVAEIRSRAMAISGFTDPDNKRLGGAPWAGACLSAGHMQGGCCLPSHRGTREAGLLHHWNLVRRPCSACCLVSSPTGAVLRWQCVHGCCGLERTTWSCPPCWMTHGPRCWWQLRSCWHVAVARWRQMRVHAVWRPSLIHL